MGAFSHFGTEAFYVGAFSHFGTEAFYGRSEISLCEVA
jgi:hypothetical protein